MRNRRPQAAHRRRQPPMTAFMARLTHRSRSLPVISMERGIFALDAPKVRDAAAMTWEIWMISWVS